MNKIYVGEVEVANVGSGGGGGATGNYVDVSTWDEHEKVIASALVDLKQLEKDIEAFDETIQKQEDALLAEVHIVEQQKADASVVYTKKEIDKSDKVVAAALASQDARILALEQGSGGGSSFDPTAINASVNAIEADYVKHDDISTFITADYTYSKSHIDASVDALNASVASLDASITNHDASILSLDASIRQLAESGGSGGGESDPAFVKYTNTSDSTKVGIVSTLRTAADNTSIGKCAIVLGDGIATGINSFSLGPMSAATGGNSIAMGAYATASGNNSVAIGFGDNGAVASGEYSMAIAGGQAQRKFSISIGRSYSKNQAAIAIGSNNEANGQSSIAIG